MSNIWDSLFQGAWVTSLAQPYAVYTTCLLGLGQIQYTVAVLGGHPIVLESLMCWNLLLQLGCAFTNNLSWAPFVALSLNFSAQLLHASNRAGSWRQESMQRPWKGDPFWFAPQGLLSLIFY